MVCGRAFVGFCVRALCYLGFEFSVIVVSVNFFNFRGLIFLEKAVELILFFLVMYRGELGFLVRRRRFFIYCGD